MKELFLRLWCDHKEMRDFTTSGS